MSEYEGGLNALGLCLFNALEARDETPEAPVAAPTAREWTACGYSFVATGFGAAARVVATSPAGALVLMMKVGDRTTIVADKKDPRATIKALPRNADAPVLREQVRKELERRAQ